jgi:hypothetical protein
MTKTAWLTITPTMLEEMDGALNDGKYEPYIKIAAAEYASKKGQLKIEATIEDLWELRSRYDFVAFCSAAEMSYDPPYQRRMLRMATAALKRIDKAIKEIS